MLVLRALGLLTVAHREPLPVPAVPSDEAPRLLRHPAVRLVVLIVSFVALSVMANALMTAVGGNPIGSLVVGVAAAAVALTAYAVACRVLERRSPVELPARAAWPTLRTGVVAGSALFTMTILVIALLGGYRIVGWGSVGGLLATTGVMAVVAVTEEILFRGVLFRIVEELTGTWGALAISAGLFGLLHLVNPGATVWGAVAIAIEAGAMLGAAYAATRTLWLPIGLHLGWNVAEAGIFGTTVSGSEPGLSGLLEGALSGPAALTGGTFGPEASLVAIIACMVPTILFLRIARQRGHIYGRRQRRTGPHQAT